MPDYPNILDFNNSIIQKSGQTTNYTGAGPTAQDDGGKQYGIAKKYTALTTGQYSGTTTLTLNGKNDVHSNNVVVDNNLSIMWMRYVNSSVFGGSSTLNLYWTDGATNEDIFFYCDQANTQQLAGHTGWFVPNLKLLRTLIDWEQPNGVPNAAFFPSFPAAEIWSSTTPPAATTVSATCDFSTTIQTHRSRTLYRAYCLLCRAT